MIVCVVISMATTLYGEVEKLIQMVEKSKSLQKNSNLVILNDGRKTRLDPQTGKISCLDITLGTPALAAKSKNVSLK